MSRSSHILFRRRHNAIEITVSRGVTAHEIEMLMGRLVAHRLSTHTTYVYLVDRRRRKLGTLDQIDMVKLKQKIFEILVKKKTVGLHIIDESGGGALLTPHVYDGMGDFVKNL